ncbi:MAG: hypothetical protein KatS3mg098_544 [Candidatus Parcubacteria bacterium]|nr:MAG: hypothetical protein KatS3mg098_544 [Candidatus Parcubacteria bacterium]
MDNFLSQNPPMAAKNPVSSDLPVRPPIIVVMGHVDHGKTTLLDYLRKTKVAEKEAGGITQSIGAYEIIFKGEKITFIDTPGHAAFTKMRERGAKVADIAILVVAADDGVQPQTEEAITILKNSNTPFVVAINKIDKSNADVERVKQDLLYHGVELEGFGGHIPWQAISAKTGEGVDGLLELLLLMWQMNPVSFNPQGLAKGFILEARVDSQKGILASVIVTDGTLKVGQNIVTSSAGGKIKALENFLGERVSEITPSSPALVIGFEELPTVGEIFEAGELEIGERVKMILEKKEKKSSEILKIEKEENTLPLILKADVSGSLEALSQIISSVSFEGFSPKIVLAEVGDITDGDVKLAQALKALIVGFNCKISKPAANLARSAGVEIVVSNIIYHLIEALEEKLKTLQSKEGAKNILEILAVFNRKGKKQVVGGQVKEGFFTLNQKVQIERSGEIVGVGRIINLQKEKVDCRKVDQGQECGLMIESEAEILVGDKIISERS